MHKKIVASMATFPDRIKTLEQVVDSLVHQVDTMYIYLNKFKEVPSFLMMHDNIVAILGKDAYGDISASGKMIFLDYELNSDVYVFTVDDDFIYPDNYATTMIENLQEFDENVACSVHGSVIPDFASWYYDRTAVYGHDLALDQYKVINLLGSGTALFPLKNLNLKMDDFLQDVSVDVTLSFKLLEADIPLIAVPREKFWLKSIKYKGLFQKFKQDKITYHTEVLSTNSVWRLDNIKHIWTEFINNNKKFTDNFFEYAISKNIELNFITSLSKTSLTPLSWQPTLKTFDRMIQFYHEK